MVLLFLTLLLPLLIAPTVDAGPLHSFALSPIPYWDDDSEDIDISWDPTDETITIEGNQTRYFEDMSVVTDWADESLEAGDSFSTDGDVLTIAAVGDGDNDNDRIDSAQSFTVTSGTAFQIRYKMSGTTGVDLIQVLLFDGADYYFKNFEFKTAWYTYTGHLSDFTVSGTPENIDNIMLGIRLDNTADEDFFVDYIRIWNELSDLDIGVPIIRQESQTIELYVNSTDLDSDVRLELYNDGKASGTYCSFNNTYVTFADDNSILGTTYAQTDGYSRISFSLDYEQATGEITVFDGELMMQNWWVDTYTLSGNNWLRMTDSVFNGSFMLYYLNGDTNYTYILTTPTWSKTGTEDPDVTQHQQGIFVQEEDNAVDHDVIYSITLPYLGYLRTEFALSYDATDTDGDTTNRINMTIDIDTFRFYMEMNCTDIGGDVTLSTIISVSNITDDSDFYIQELGKINAVYAQALGKIMLWRTQENHLAIMFWGESICEDIPFRLFTEGWKWDDELRSWLDVSGENETIWISDFVIDDWSESQVSLGYMINAPDATDDPYLDFQYNYFEYDYWMSSGVAQPHFSSTWWERKDARYDAGEYIQDYDQWANYMGLDVTNNPYDPSDPPLSPIDQIIQNIGFIIGTSIETLVSNIAGFFSSGITIAANMAWAGFLDVILTGLTILASVWEQVLNFIWPGSGTAFNSFFAGVGGTIGTIGTLIVSFFSFLISIVDYIATALTWANTYLFTADVATLVLIVIIALPLTAFAGMQDFKGTGYEGALNWVLVYVSIFTGIASLAWRLIEGIINTVANFIPLT